VRALLLLPLLGLAADLTPPRTEPSHFPRHVQTGRITIAADYLVRSLPGHRDTFLTRDYLVVEVALFPHRGAETEASPSHFTLRLNGKFSKTPEAPQMVAASLKYDDWTERPRLEAAAGAGNGAVIIGRPQRDPRFPGDPTARRLPPPPKVDPNIGRGAQQREPELAHETALALAFPEKKLSGPERGYLYFAYGGKTQSLKKVELVYHGPEGQATLPLR
jgi:hypothetical protein